MLKKLCTISAIVLTMYANSQWSALTSGTTEDLKSINFPTATTGYTVGLGATILKTIDGGATWTAQTAPISQDLYSVIFMDENTGLAMGDGGRIIKTTDGGSTWTLKTSGTTNALYSSYMVNSTTIYAAGASGTILTSIDGGETWTALTSGTSEDINAIAFDKTNPLVGYFVGNNASVSYAYKTTNGGVSWTSQALPANNVVSFFGISMIDANSVYFCGGVSKILKTTNGGSTWSNVNSTIANYYRGILFTSATEGYAVGGSGKIAYTSNGGTSYTSETTGSTSILNSIIKTSCGSLFVAGNGGTLLKKSSPISGTADAYTTSGSSTLTVNAASGVLANDGLSGVTVAVGTTTANGTLTLNSDGSFTYTPNTGFTGTDQFTYIITDGCGNTSSPVTVTITSTAGIGNLGASKVSIYTDYKAEAVMIHSEIKKITKIQVINSLGQSVYDDSGLFSSKEISIKNYSKGVYFVTVFNETNESYTSKFIKF